MSAIPLNVTEDGMPTARVATATGPIELYLAAVESRRWGTWKRGR